MDWLERLRRLSPDRRAVLHEPETPRYSRARQKLAFVIRQSRLLGFRPDPEREHAVLVALWAPPEVGRGPGYYTCFRLYQDEREESVFAVLYCFYDGSERSPAFRSYGAAQSFAETQGFLLE